MTCTACVHAGLYSAVTLADGREVCSGCPDWRHECEARAVLKMPGTQQRRDFLDLVEKKRGKPSADALRLTVRQLWELRKPTVAA